MGAWISYTLVSGVILLFLYLMYSWVMADDNQPRFNRAVLLCCYALAALLPMADFSFTSEVANNTGMAEIGMPVAGAVVVDDVSTASIWPWVIVGVYVAGALVVAVMTVVALVRLGRIVAKAEKISVGSYTVAVVDDDTIAPFSWFCYIVMNRADYRDYRDLILTHEVAHLDRLHRIDLLIARIFEIVMWYNPVAWLVTSSLRSVHEYEADRAVIERVDNQRDYQMLLIKKAVGRSFPVLANSLNHSNLKKRITMMLNPKSRKARRVRVLALAPAVAVALLCVNLPFVARAIDSVSSIALLPDSNGKDSENATKLQDSVETRITVDGEQCSVRVFINGKESTRSLSTLSPDSIKSISVFKNRDEIHIETYKPGEPIPESKAAGNARSGHDVDDIVVVGVGSARKDGGEAVFSTVEEMPRFPGGEVALMEFLRDNIKYPESELNNTGRHRVVVKFVVGSDGTVRDAEILRGESDAFNAEALRVINMLPKYIPGKVNGKPVSVYYTLPIVFSSTEEKNDSVKQ